MSKEDIIKMIEIIDKSLKLSREKGGAYIPTTRMLVDLRKWWTDKLLQDYGVFYD